ISAFSEGEGRGSRFVIGLPMAGEQADPPARPATPGLAVCAPGTQRSAIIIDDNRDAAESLCALLTALGYDCHSYFDGPSGIAAVERRPPDVVFVDIGMP